MPIDPSILSGIRYPEQEDSLTRYGRIAQLSNLQLDNQKAREEMRINNELRQYLPTVTDFNDQSVQTKLRTFGKPGIELAKGLSDAETAELTRKEKENDLLVKNLSNMKEVLATRVRTPDDAKAYVKATFTNPTMSRFLQSQGMTEERAMADLDDNIRQGKLNEWVMRGVQGAAALEKHFITRDLGDRSEITAVSQVGGAETVPGSVRAIGMSPNRSQTNINVNMGNAKEFGKQVSRDQAKGFSTLAEAAEEAPYSVETSERILSLLDKHPVTGFGAEFRLNLEKIANLAGYNNDNLISDTESLWSSMANTTLARIKTSGLGTGQGFTERDKEWLQEAAAGKKSMSADTLRQLAIYNRQAAIRTAERYNQKAARLDPDVLQNTTLPQRVEIPKVNTKLGVNSKTSKIPIPAALKKSITAEQWNALPESGKLLMIKKYGK